MATPEAALRAPGGENRSKRGAYKLRESATPAVKPRGLDPGKRYRIREIFHRPEITDNYDYVIFDCPPRLTTAAVPESPLPSPPKG